MRAKELVYCIFVIVSFLTASFGSESNGEVDENPSVPGVEVEVDENPLDFLESTQVDTTTVEVEDNSSVEVEREFKFLD